MDKMQKDSNSNYKDLKAFGIFWLAAVIQGFFAIALLLGLNQKSVQASISSISSMRILVIIFILLLTLAFLLLAYLHFRAQNKYHIYLNKASTILENEQHYFLISTIIGAILIGFLYLISVTPELEEPFTQSLLENILPLMVWICGLASQSLLVLVFLKFNIIRDKPKPLAFLFSLFILGITFIAWGWVTQVSLPLESQVRGWNRQGVPILETQLFFAWVISMSFSLFLVALERKVLTRSSGKNIKPAIIDITACLLIWIAAVLTWQSISIPTSWFITENRPPNFEPYPNSDAYLYDTTAQTALVGEGFIFASEPYIRRPLHAAYLTILHWIGGQDYSKVISLQILVLALLPVLAYLVALTLHNRISGLLVALIILMREASSIAISGNITASHVKLLMVDVFVALMITLFVLAVLHWLKNLPHVKSGPLITGGVLGASVLIRNETVILVIPLALILWWSTVKEKRGRLWTKQMLLFTWGLLLVISPWVWRNYSLTGKIFIDSPIMRFDLIAQRYQDVQDKQPQPQENSPTPTAPNIQSEETPSPPEPNIASGEETTAEQYVQSVAEQTLEFIIGKPGEVSKFIISHYTNSQLQTILVFPSSLRPIDSLIGFSGHRSLEIFFDECCSMQNYTRRLPFWHKWDGKIPSQSVILIILNLILLSWGVQIAWQTHRITGIAPISFAFTYIILNALFRNSGGRYILPVDWIPMIYYCIGLADISIRLLYKILGIDLPVRLFNRDPLNSAGKGKPFNLQSPAFFSLSIGLFLLGSLIPLTEKAFSQRYTSSLQENMITTLFESDLLQPNEKATLDEFVAQGGTIVTGRALYPRYFREFIGEPGSNNPFGPRDYPRIGFYLAGPQHSTVVLPSQTKPEYFPNASDVVVFRCSIEEVLAVAVFNQEQAAQAIYMRSPLPLNISCPFPAQDISIQEK